MVMVQVRGTARNSQYGTTIIITPGLATRYTQTKAIEIN